MFDFILKIEGKEDLKLTQRISQLCLSDESGSIDDELSFEFVFDEKMDPPKLGSSVSISFGPSKDLIEWGAYKISSLELKDGIFSVRSYASEEIASLRNKRQKYWNTSLGKVISEIALSVGVSKIVDEKFFDRKVQITQEESDLSFLHRLAKKYNAILKINNNKIVFVTREFSELPKFKFSNHFPWSWQKSKKTTGVKAHFWDRDKRTQSVVMVGEEGSVVNLPGTFSNEEKAREHAVARLLELENNVENLHFVMPSSPEFNTARISSGCRFDINIFPKFVNGLWSVKRVEHRLSSDHGLTADVQCVRQNQPIL